MSSSTRRPLPLEGVRVLDISQVMAGPYACMLLGDLGADVIKIEKPGRGDGIRYADRTGRLPPEIGGLNFQGLNRNKRGLTIDIGQDQGAALMRRLGLGYEVLKDINPRLVYTSISGFGQNGPWADRPGFDLMAQAMSGVMSVTGYPDSPPVKCGVPVADIGCALFAIYATLSAYIGAKNTGEGQYVDASLFDTALAFSVWDICDYWGTGKPPQPLGTSNKMTAPYQAMASSDGYFVMGANNQKLWDKLCRVMRREELLDDERFKTISLRLANRAALEHELEKTFRTQTKDYWVDTLLEAGIPAGPILSYPEAFDSDHAVARRMKMQIAHPIEGEVPNIGFAVKLSGTPQQVQRHPPLLGEHTAEVLAEFGIGEDERAALEAQGAFSA